jgi:hypothetical protein
MAGTFPISGHIDPKSFPFLLADLHRNGATGSLKVEGPTYQKALYFRSGRILFGSSNDPRDQLGAILIEDGRITPEQLEDVNSKVGPGNPLAKVLAETGFVSQRELSDAARAKVERILSDLIAYTSGNFEFEDGVLPKGAVDLKLSTERLLLSAVHRLSDRSFVLRHLEGLDVVLRRTADMDALRAEVEPETGGLLAHIDGVASLKEAAGRTRLDDFEAAKVACGLLFLGAVERADGEVLEADVLDLGVTARAAFETDDWATPPPEAAPAPPPARRNVGDDSIIAWAEASPTVFEKAPPPEPTVPPPAFSFSDDPATDPLLATHTAPALDVRPPAPRIPVAVGAPPAAAVTAIPPARSPLPPVVAEPPPAAPSPPLAPPPPAGAATRPPTPPPWTPPGARVAVPPTVPPRPPGSSRPSKDDLAALDALLDPRTLEGPLEPLEREPDSRWTPPARSVQARRSASSSAARFAMVAAAVLVLAGGAAAAWWFLLGGRGSTGAARPMPSPSAVAAPPSAIPTAAVSVTPGSLPVAPATAAPVEASAPPTAAPALPRPGNALDQARGALRQGQLREAAQGFASHLRAAPAGTASIQLLIACSPETVDKALAAVDAAQFFIVPVNFRGRDCFRLCWGLYGNGAAAADGLRTVPEYFVRGGATPRVMSAAELRQ